MQQAHNPRRKLGLVSLLGRLQCQAMGAVTSAWVLFIWLQAQNIQEKEKHSFRVSKIASVAGLENLDNCVVSVFGECEELAHSS